MTAAARFTRAELKTLYAVFDTVVPAIPVEQLIDLSPALVNIDIEDVAAFAAETPSSLEQVKENTKDMLPRNLPPQKMAELKQVLGLLRWGEEVGLC